MQVNKASISTMSTSGCKSSTYLQLHFYYLRSWQTFQKTIPNILILVNMQRSYSKLALLPLFILLFAREILCQTTSWIGRMDVLISLIFLEDGTWENPSNWNNGVPQQGFTAIINGTFNIYFNSSKSFFVFYYLFLVQSTSAHWLLKVRLFRLKDKLQSVESFRYHTLGLNLQTQQT